VVAVDVHLMGAGDAPPRRERRAGRLRRRLASARWRIVGWYVVLLALALLASLLVVRSLLVERVEAQIDADLAQEVDELRALAAGVDPADGEPFAERVDRLFDVFLSRNIPAPNETMIAFVDGRPYLRSVDQPPLRLDRDPELVARWADLAEPQRGHVTTDEVGRVDYLAVPLLLEGDVSGVFVVAAFTELAMADVDEIVRLSAMVGAGALLFGLVLAWSVSSRVLAPVRELTDTARAITDTDLSRRIEVPGDDEVGHLAETFNGMLDRLESAFTTQREFIDDAGHELRTPITIVRGHLELLEDDPAERAETLALVMDELDRMHRMVEDLLLLAKAQQPDFLRLAVVDLAELTAEVHAKARAIAPRGWRLAATDRTQVVLDRQRVTQALVQLAQNAVAHAGEGATITIGSAVRGGRTHLWVADDGPGLPAGADRDRLFARFSRGQGGPRSEGAGLGLAIVRAIAEAHGGTVAVDSIAGAGATFTLVLPLDPQDPRSTTP
jgi:two-component system, OmpR family, sensor kinase